MSNCCDYTMRVVGKEDGVKKFSDAMEKRKIGSRIYSAYIIGTEELDDGLFAYEIDGDCAWSVDCSMLQVDDPKRNLEDVSLELNLAIEVFSSEPGVGFEEHCIIAKGKVIEYKCLDLDEYYIEDFEDDDEIEDICELAGVSKEELLKVAKENDGYYFGDGFGEEYGNFTDLTVYLK